MQDDNISIAGKTILVDCRDFGINHLKHFTPTFLKRLLLIEQNANSVRVKAQHCFNVPTIGTTLLKTWRLLSGEKMRQRVCSKFISCNK